MKKALFTLAALFVAAISASADDTFNTFTIGWHHTLDSQPNAGDSPLSVDVAADGNYLVFHTWGSTGGQDGAEKDENAQFKIDGVTMLAADGKPIVGAGYWSGNSYNANIGLEKVNKETGAVEWMVYSDRGDCLNGYTHAQPAADGGAYLLLYARHWDEDTETTLIRLRSTKQTEAVTIETQAGLFYDSGDNLHKFYVPVLAKVSADGLVEWAKVIIEPEGKEIGSRYPAWLSFTNSFVVAEDGSIYVGGNYRTTITFTDKDGNRTSTTARNVVGWNGDDQNVIGDLYLAKFDAEGNFLKLFTIEGDDSYAAMAFVDNLAVVDGTVYFEGRVQSNTPFQFGDATITASLTGQSMLYGAFDTDLTPRYVKLLTQTGTSGVLQCENIQYLNGSLYFTGSSMKQTYTDEDGNTVLAPNATGSTLHQGFIIKVNPEDGSIIAAGNQGNPRSISKYFGVFETRDAKGNTGLYALGYEFTGGSLICAYSVDEYAKTMTRTGYQDLVTYGTSATGSGTISACGTPAVVNGEVVFMHRLGANNQDKQAHFADGTVSATVHSWASVVFAIRNADIYVAEAETPAETSVSVTLAAELGTLSSTQPLNFTEVKGLKAYIASGFNPSTGELLLTRVYNVPAGEGVLLQGEADQSYDIPVAGTDMVYSNLLVAATTAQTIAPTADGKTNYILGNGNNGIGFYRVAAEDELAAGKAYLQLPTAASEARVIRLSFSDDATGISSLSASRSLTATGTVYDLQGRQVAKPAKGLYVIDGKKVFIK